MTSESLLPDTIRDAVSTTRKVIGNDFNRLFWSRERGRRLACRQPLLPICSPTQSASLVSSCGSFYLAVEAIPTRQPLSLPQLSPRRPSTLSITTIRRESPLSRTLRLCREFPPLFIEYWIKLFQLLAGDHSRGFEGYLDPSPRG